PRPPHHRARDLRRQASRRHSRVESFFGESDMTDNPKPDRRAFLATAGAAAGFLIVKPQLVRGSQANSAVRVGLLGCGGRGTVDATSIATNGPARIVALADL